MMTQQMNGEFYELEMHSDQDEYTDEEFIEELEDILNSYPNQRDSLIRHLLRDDPDYELYPDAVRDFVSNYGRQGGGKRKKKKIRTHRKNSKTKSKSKKKKKKKKKKT
jgi:hypothetical protein